MKAEYPILEFDDARRAIIEPAMALNRIADRKSEGCLTVEMECAAFLAVAAFRTVRFGQLLATGDDVSGSDWDPRTTEEHRTFPERLFWLSVETCMKL
jgi:hypothetical protein